MPATHTLQRGTGAAAKCGGSDLGNQSEQDTSRGLTGQIPAAGSGGFGQTSPNALLASERQGKRETVCSSVSLCSLPGVGLF